MSDNKIGFLDRFLCNYAVALFAIITIGYLLGDYTKGLTGIYMLGKTGIAYRSLFQLGVLMVINTGYEYAMCHILWMQQKSFTWKVGYMMLSCGLTTAVGCFLFQWFPIDYIESWIGFLISYLLCFTLSISIMLWKRKRDEHKYNVLLSNLQKRDKK